MSSLAVYGAGYVGLVSAAGFAKLGAEVTCVDINPDKIAQLKQNQVPFYEPGLAALLAEHKVNFTTDISTTAKTHQTHLIAVGTPSNPDGSVDMRAYHQCLTLINEYKTPETWVINKSTVPIGTTEQARQDYGLTIISNPEFLREGSAINDFLNPDRIIIGLNPEDNKKPLINLYGHLSTKIQWLDPTSAEISKYGANSLLASKISFMNELSQITEAYGGDIELIKHSMGLDHRIGPHFINPGCGFGGSCFPKDLRALQHQGQAVGVDTAMLDAIIATNQRQKIILAKKLGHAPGKTIAVWGLAFKPNTDDTREASAVATIEHLLTQDVTIQVYDPIAQYNFGTPRVTPVATAEAALDNADCLLILTEWDEFKSIDPKIFLKLKDKLILDGRNIYDPECLRALGLNYQGIGR